MLFIVAVIQVHDALELAALFAVALQRMLALSYRIAVVDYPKTSICFYYTSVSIRNVSIFLFHCVSGLAKREDRAWGQGGKS